MIGGTDIYIDVPAGAAAIDFALRAIRACWPNAVFENANAPTAPVGYDKLDFSNLSEVMAYKDMKSALAWESLGADPSLDGTMIHLMLSSSHLALVVDDQPSAEIKAIVDIIDRGLKENASRGIRLKEAA